MKKNLIIFFTFIIVAILMEVIDDFLGFADFYETIAMWKQIVHKICYGLWGGLLYAIIKK